MSKAGNSLTKLPANAGRGRPKGSPNRTTVLVKQAMLAVYEDLQAAARKQDPKLGEHAHFRKWADDHPTEYYKLLARLLPMQIEAEAGPRLARALTWLPPS